MNSSARYSFGAFMLAEKVSKASFKTCAIMKKSPTLKPKLVLIALPVVHKASGFSEG